MAVELKIGASEIEEDLRRAGFYRAEVTRGDTYRDLSTVLLCPTRGGKPKDWVRPDGVPVAEEPMMPARVLFSLAMLVKPPNHRTASKLIVGDEVGRAYNRGIGEILADPSLSQFAFLLTHEDDNILPPCTIMALQDAIERGPYDAVGGLYHMKGAMAVPMAFGRPGVTDGSGMMDFTPRDLTDAIMASNRIANGEAIPGDEDASIVEVNGIACGATLWRMSLFRELEPPWFTTFARFRSGKMAEAMTQDLAFCKKAREAGKRFAVDCRVKVGHLDVETGVVY